MAKTTKIFSKKLTKTDVGVRMSIPTKKLVHFPRFQHGCHAIKLLVEDEEGHKFNMWCAVRRQRHKKPVMTTGWKRFISTKNLNIGDKVTFYKVEDEVTEAKYKIKVKRAEKEQEVPKTRAPGRMVVDDINDPPVHQTSSTFKLFGFSISDLAVHAAAQ